MLCAKPWAQSPAMHKPGLLEGSLSYKRACLKNKTKIKTNKNPQKTKLVTSKKHKTMEGNGGEWLPKGDDARADLSNAVIKGDACPTPAQSTHLLGHRAEQTLKACQMTGCPGNPAASLGRPRVAVRVEQDSGLGWRLGK